MEGLVNYSSEDDQDDYPYGKVAVRERGGGAHSTGRPTADASVSLKRPYENSRNGSCEHDGSPYGKGRGIGSERYKSGNTHYEDKYKIDRRTDKSREHRDKKDNRESRNNRDFRDDGRDYDNSHKYDYKKVDDHKRYREPKRDYKRDSDDYHREDKRYNRFDERKSNYNPNYKERFNNSKSRYEEKKHYDDRFDEERRERLNEERRSGGGPNSEDRKRDFNDKRNFNHDDDRKADRRNNDDRKQRSYNEDRSNTYRPRRSNSPGPSRSNNINNKYYERKDEGSSRRDRKRHSRSRSRSHSAEATQSKLTDNNSVHQRSTAGDLSVETKRPEGETHVTDKKSLPTARNFEALLNLPLSENAPKIPNILTVPATSTAVGSIPTSAPVQLPSYYNPNVINPNKYVEQMQKRKLIWGAKKTEDSASKWGHAQFSQDQDGKVASKFMRLMGIKNSSGDSSTSPNNESEKKSPTTTTTTDVKSREAMFSSMEQQYEVARQVTHTMRGVGLGFGSQPRPY